jgi:acyl-CoA thioesterase II
VFDSGWISIAAHASSIAIPGWLCLGPPGGKHLSGGAATALLAMRAQALADKPLVAISTQFLAPMPSGAVMDLHADIVRAGRNFVYADARLILGNTHAARAQAICGNRAGITADLIPFPSVDSPGNCPPMPWIRRDAGDQHDHLDIRLAEAPAVCPDRHGQRGGRYWVALPPQFPMLAMLAIAADYLPEMLHMRLGERVGAISLDNQLRIVGQQNSQWILCDATIEAAADGMFLGHIRLFSETGALLATGGQSGLIMPLR